MARPGVLADVNPQVFLESSTGVCGPRAVYERAGEEDVAAVCEVGGRASGHREVDDAQL